MAKMRKILSDIHERSKAPFGYINKLCGQSKITNVYKCGPTKAPRASIRSMDDESKKCLYRQSLIMWLRKIYVPLITFENHIIL